MAQYKDKLVEQYLQEPLKLQDPVKVTWLDTKTEIQGRGKSKKEVEVEKKEEMPTTEDSEVRYWRYQE